MSLLASKGTLGLYSKYAPTRANLAAEQQTLTANGCPQSLLAVLTTPT